MDGTLSKVQIVPTSSATGIILHRDKKIKPVTIIGTAAICNAMDQDCLQQALNASASPGVTNLVLSPDAHKGYGAPIGCIMVSPTHIYPGPVGVDVKCSISLLQLDLHESDIADKKVRPRLINAITERIPTGPGAGQRSVKKSRCISEDVAIRAIIEGASKSVCNAIGIPKEWSEKCEVPFHRGHDGTIETLERRLELLRRTVFTNFSDKLDQLGSYGGGNHFGECEILHVLPDEKSRKTAKNFGLIDGAVAFFSHCGSRGFGNILAKNQFRVFQADFVKKGLPFPANDPYLVHAQLGTQLANEYLDDMALGANFATVNHLLINSLVHEAFEEVFPGVKAELVYLISHNIARKEKLQKRDVWVHRKGATRAFPAGHPELAGTPYYKTGHPILLPGNPVSGSVIMVADAGAEKSCFSVNHGAGRAIGRKAAYRMLDQTEVNRTISDADILTNCRQYPKDEAPSSYKDFSEVIRSIEEAGLARTVASMRAKFVIKESSNPDD